MNISHRSAQAQPASQPDGQRSAIQQDAEFASYSAAVKEVKALQGRLKTSIAQLDAKRDEYSKTADSLKGLIWRNICSTWRQTCLP